MKKRVLMGVLATLTMASGADAAIVFGVDELNNLVSFDSSAPGTTLASVAITGTTAGFQALDFRPLNGVLYGLSADRIIYTIDTTSGAATAVSGVLALAGTEFGFDFNPTIDRLRIVSNTNQNYVFNPNNGVLTGAADGVIDVAYAAGDPNFGSDPDIVGSAYTSSVFGAPAGTTQLYGFDTNLNVLVRQANSAGTLNTVGPAGVNLGTRVSFDIAGTDALAINGTRLYSVNLSTGAFTLIGNTSDALFGMAIAVPEPTTWAMLVAGVGLMGGVLRRRASPAVRFA